MDFANLKLKKVYTITEKAMRPRIWLYELVCETAGFKPGEELFITTDEDKQCIIVTNVSNSNAKHRVHVSSRKNETSGKQRPIVDTAKESYRSIIDRQQKVEVSVFREGLSGTVIIEPLKFRPFEKEVLQTNPDERITTFTIGSGAGFVTAAFQDTGYFTSKGAVELEEDSAAVFKHNFPSSFVFNGDLLDCNTVTSADVAIVTLPCNEHSSLGGGEAGIFNNLALATAELIKATRCRAAFFENVPSFYKSDIFTTIKDLLKDEFPYWQERNLEAHDFGSLALRNRTYVVALRHHKDFAEFEMPVAPKGIRKKKVKDYLDGKDSVHTWKSLEKWMENFRLKAEKDNSWKDRGLSKTFVGEQATVIQCIPKRYTGQSASSTYLKSKDEKEFRFFSISEIRKMLSIPEWFEYPDYVGKIRQYEMLGQSVDCRVIKAIANRLATMFYKSKRYTTPLKKQTPIAVHSSGQVGFVF